MSKILKITLIFSPCNSFPTKIYVGIFIFLFIELFIIVSRWKLPKVFQRSLNSINRLSIVKNYVGPDAVAQGYNPSTWELESRRPGVQGHPWLHSLGNIRHCLKNIYIVVGNFYLQGHVHGSLLVKWQQSKPRMIYIDMAGR